MTSEPSTLRYRPEIDGLRAVAVLPVLLFHAGFGAPGGFAGVDVFFVISGYLIGSLILRDEETGGFQYVAFWTRRVRRLFPALAVVVMATIITGSFLLIPVHQMSLGDSVIAQSLLVANFHFWSQSGYFETASEFLPLLHTWSLAVEEQFYLFLPLLLVPALRAGRKPATVIVLAVTLISLLWCCFTTKRYPDAAFFLLPARVWELNFGVLLALVDRRGFRSAWLNRIGAPVGIMLIVGSYFLYDGNTPFPGIAALAPCLGTAIFLFTNSGSITATGRLLSNPVAVWVGKISYSLYLWHWPCLVFLRYLTFSKPALWQTSAALLLSVLLAWMTWKWIEEPVRRRRFLGEDRRLLTASAVATVLLIAAGLILHEMGRKNMAADGSGIVSEGRKPDVEGFYVMRQWEREGGPPGWGPTKWMHPIFSYGETVTRWRCCRFWMTWVPSSASTSTQPVSREFRRSSVQSPRTLIRSIRRMRDGLKRF
jgi:peptidoglycan/LPS O-acetylase OafA/YrhL